MRAIRCRAVLFDLDGVLVDSTPCVERHWKEWAIQHGRDPEEILRIAHGRRTVETLQMIAPELDIAVEFAMLAANEAVDLEGVQVMPGARELMESLPQGQWTVVTSGTREVARARLQHCGLPITELMVTADDVQHGKPAPDGYLAAAAALRSRPEDCVVVEDAPPGIEAAHSAGMPVIAVASTHAPVHLMSAEALVRDISAIQVRLLGGGIELRSQMCETSRAVPYRSSGGAVSQNKETVERYINGFRKSDHEQILACLTDDIEWLMPGAFHLRGKEAFDNEIENEAFTGRPQLEIVRMVEEGDVVVAEGTVRAAWKHGGFLNGVFCDVFEMLNGKIKRLVTYQVTLEERSS